MLINRRWKIEIFIFIRAFWTVDGFVHSFQHGKKYTHKSSSTWNEAKNISNGSRLSCTACRQPNESEIHFIFIVGAFSMYNTKRWNWSDCLHLELELVTKSEISLKLKFHPLRHDDFGVKSTIFEIFRWIEIRVFFHSLVSIKMWKHLNKLFKSSYGVFKMAKQIVNDTFDSFTVNRHDQLVPISSDTTFSKVSKLTGHLHSGFHHATFRFYLVIDWWSKTGFPVLISIFIL